MKVFLFILLVISNLFAPPSKLYLKCKKEMNGSCKVESLYSLVAKKDALAIKVNDDMFTPTDEFNQKIEDDTILLEKEIITLINAEIEKNGAGEATLTKYNANKSLMSLSLKWNKELDKLIAIKKLNKKVSLKIQPKVAREIFEKQRTQQFYIDISYLNHKIKIGKLYITDKDAKYIFSSSNSSIKKVNTSHKHITTINNKMWQDEPYTDRESENYGGNTDFGKVGRWGYADKYCKNLELGGYTDWRLPSKSELQALYKNKSQLKNVSDTWYWTSTKYKNKRTSFWIVDFTNGGGGGTWTNDGRRYFVRCVRQ